jgi:hypothetical protein
LDPFPDRITSSCFQPGKFPWENPVLVGWDTPNSITFKAQPIYHPGPAHCMAAYTLRSLPTSPGLPSPTLAATASVHHTPFPLGLLSSPPFSVVGSWTSQSGLPSPPRCCVLGCSAGNHHPPGGHRAGGRAHGAGPSTEPVSAGAARPIRDSTTIGPRHLRPQPNGLISVGLWLLLLDVICFFV